MIQIGFRCLTTTEDLSTVPIQNVQYLICEDHDRGSGLQHVFSLRQIFQMNLSYNLIGVDWDKAVIKVQLKCSDPCLPVWSLKEFKDIYW